MAVTVHVGDKSFDTYALLDDGSQSTLLRREFFDKMGVKGKPKKILETTVKDDPQPVTVDELSMVVSARDGTNSLEIKSVLVQPTDMFNMPSRPRVEANSGKTYSHLQGLEFDAVKAEDISLLIGCNAPKAHLYDATRTGGDEDPIAIRTRFGWTLFGPSVCNTERGNMHCSAMLTDEVMDQAMESFWENEDPPTIFTNKLAISSTGDPLHEAVEMFWQQEHCGILPQKDVAMSREDMDALEEMDKKTKLVNNRYEVPMLWADPNPSLPPNLPMAKRRYPSILRKQRMSPDFHKKCKVVIDGYLKADPPQARKMTAEEASKTSSKTWTLPTHPVVHPNKPDKVRLCNDAAAEFGGISLNKSLVTGPDLLNRLVGVLMRCRVGEVAIAADIEAMFHQVRVSPEDADALRFLWKEDITTDDPPDTYQMLVHIFGAKCSPTCANYALQRTARDNYKKFNSLTYSTVINAFYVDDLLKSVESDAVAITLAKELKEMLKCGGFRLCKFTSNSPGVLAALPESDVSSSSTISIGEEGEKVERALGIGWDTKTDVFTYTTQFKEAPMTKKGILSVTSSLFDPMGFLVPFLLLAKILLQALWRLGYSWDEEINETLKSRWRKWLKSAEKVSRVRINRQYVPLRDRRITEIQLHVFCDASEDAYGAVAYVRYSFKNGEHACALVMAKSRLAPIKTVTLPRLELEGARCGARLARLILQELDLPIERVQYWSDSTLTLQYIKNRRHRMKSRVANRVTEICETSSPEEWTHIPGTINPADLLTRGVSDPEKLMTNRWFIGPQYLEKDEEEWPTLTVQDLD